MYLIHDNRNILYGSCIATMMRSDVLSHSPRQERPDEVDQSLQQKGSRHGGCGPSSGFRV